MIRRLLLFAALNILIVFTIGLLLAVFNVAPYITEHGLSYSSLLAFSLIWGFGGAFISLCLSKRFARMAMRVKLIKEGQSKTDNEARVSRLLEKVCQDASFTYPLELGTFECSKPNAFATGRSQKTSMIAVSNSLIEAMDDDELSAVLAHELAHIRSGDMVSMTLLQGTINAFVIFLSRILAYALTRGDKNSRRSPGMSYYFTAMFVEMVLMIPAIMLLGAFSRRREFKADKSAALVTSPNSMISALKRLGAKTISKEESAALKPYAAFMITKTQKPILRLFATHPPLEARIKALESLEISLNSRTTSTA